MQPAEQAFYRGTDRILAGVCSGLAAGLHVPVIWVRIAFVLLAFLQGIGAFIYIVLWLVMPERAEAGVPRSGFDSMASDLKRVGRELQTQFGGLVGSAPAPQNDPGAPPSPVVPPAPPPQLSGSARQNQSLVIGLILVLGGVVLLAANTGFVAWSIIWPVLLVIVGIVLLIRTVERRR